MHCWLYFESGIELVFVLLFQEQFLFNLVSASELITSGLARHSSFEKSTIFSPNLFRYYKIYLLNW
jgi:hypothetical protein